MKVSINMHLKVVYTENNVLPMYLEFIVKRFTATNVLWYKIPSYYTVIVSNIKQK